MSRSHGLLQLSERIFNTPQCMSIDSFERLTNYVIDRNTGQLSWQMNIDESAKGAKEKAEEEAQGKVLALNPLKANSFKRPDFSAIPEEDRDRAYAQYLDFIQYDPKMKLGVLNVEGTTVYRSTPFEALCGMTSYQRLERTLKAQIAEGAKTVLMYVDSGGGEAYGMIETAQNLRSLADKAGTKIIAYVDGTSASAGYGLTAIADEVIANPSARVGSIGVVVSLMNDSKKLEKDGLERIYLYKGDNKVAFDSDGKFSDSFLASIDSMLTETYQAFTDHVATARGIDVQRVIDTQASVYTAEDALSKGLVDKTMTRADFFEGYLMSVVNNGGGAYSQSNPYKMVAKTIQTEEVNTKMDIQDINAQVEDAVKADAGVEAVVEEATVEAGVVTEEASSIVMAGADLVSLQATVDGLQAKLQANEELITQLTQRAESAEGALSQFKQEALVADRTAKLSAVLPSDKVEASVSFAEKLSEEDFTTYLSTLESVYVQSKNDIAEIGAKAEDVSATQTFDDILKATIQKSNQANA